MSNFWLSGTGVMPTGSDRDSFIPDFEVIPHGTTAHALIKSFLLKEKDTIMFYEIIWKITSDAFQGREVRQKIKAFDQKPETRQRGLNMLKRIYDSVGHVHTHEGIPSDDDHRKLINKVLGIKIAEWQQIKPDGSGIMEGNHVSEVHKIGPDFVLVMGKKKEAPRIPLPDLTMPPVYDPNDVPWK